MKIIQFSLLGSLLILGGSAGAQTPAPTPADNASTNGTPKIQFAVTTFDFGKLSSGQSARHDFVFTNTGTATLEITAVRPSCGCTAAGEWSKTVEPGKTGIIPLQFNSAGFSGMVVKTAAVTCNDPATPNLTLQLSGNVWKEIDAQPQFAVLNGSSESVADAKASIRIINNGESPIGITSLEVNNAMFAVDLKTNQPGKEFEVAVKVVPPLNPSMTHGVITLKTTSTNVPQVQVTAMLMLQPVIAATPPQINLPPPPLNNGFIHTVTVRNSGTNFVRLSDARASDGRIGVALKETEAGKAFNLEVNIPQGFTATPGVMTEVSAKTTHPQFPEIKIPVIQMPPPPPPGVVPPAPAAPAAHAH
jgi:hypothetical protein